MSAPAPRRVAFATLGCRLNQVDTRTLQTQLEARGFATVPESEPADVVVVNTCTVTARAELSDRRAIRRAARLGPATRVVVTGCWAQTSPADVARMPGVDLVVGNADKARLPDLIEALMAGPRPEAARVQVGDLAGARVEPVAPLARVPGRSRAFLKIQDGCQHRCAFCVVPLARGASRSLGPDVIVDHARRLLGQGHRELVLTGVDLGHYGADLAPRTSLAALLGRLVALPGLRWLRLSSMLPAYFTEELLEIVCASPVVAPHFHLPLQSGSDRVLRAMRRPYTVAMYRSLVERLAAGVPGLAVGADVIAGFPGETEEDFALTERLVETLPLAYLHVFPYSARRGTEAAARPGRLDSGTVTRRAERLRALGRARAQAFRRALVGRVEEVLVLEPRHRPPGWLTGLTGGYVEIGFQGPDALVGRLACVRVTAAGAAGAEGHLVEEAA